MLSTARHCCVIKKFETNWHSLNCQTLWNSQSIQRSNSFMIEEAKRSFEQQGFMKTLGAEIIAIEKGMVKIECIKNKGLTQQHGYFHAGVITSIADVACGYAAFTTMPEGSEVLSVEFKTNLMRAATADKIIATGKVIKSGRTLIFCEATVTDEKEETIFATFQGTMFCLQNQTTK